MMVVMFGFLLHNLYELKNLPTGYYVKRKKIKSAIPAFTFNLPKSPSLYDSIYTLYIK